jgi:S-DNA-T family DNA segregation ATPase FtsK/SpoIIIE
VPVTWRAWLSALAARCAARTAAPRSRRAGCSGWAWCCCWRPVAALEWTRLYRWESALPGHAGGVLGHALGPLSMRWLGFAGSGVLWIALLVAGRGDGAALFVGARGRAHRRARRRLLRASPGAQGAGAGPAHRRAGTREREHVVEELERQIEDVHAPLVIEPRCWPCREVGARGARAPAAAVQAELTDTKLPQVDLLDAPPGGRRSVTPESLEMTSRLIEKKLKDFGVEVRWSRPRPAR